MAEPEAALRRRQGMLDNIDFEGHEFDRPVRLLGKTKVERHEKSVLKLHLLAHRDVEFVIDELFGEVPGKVRIAGYRWQRANAETFVTDGVLVGCAEGEGREFVEKEIAAVIVIDNDGDIGFDIAQPFLHWLIGVEQRFPSG